MSIIDTFKKFIADKDAFSMFIEGPAGTGKTTSLRELTNYCSVKGYSFVVCAFTHKACEVLKNKLDTNKIQTLHSFLKKRPVINVNAKRNRELTYSAESGTVQNLPRIIFVDEFSFLGEDDYNDLVYYQTVVDGENLNTKIVYIGDLNQLPPIGEQPAIEPHGDYKVKLTKNYRTDNKVNLDLAYQILECLEGKRKKLDLTKIKKKPITNILQHIEAESDAVLVYTNKAAGYYNTLIHNKAKIKSNSFYSFSLHEYIPINSAIPLKSVNHIVDLGGNKIHYNSKYKTLESLDQMKLKYPIEYYRILGENRAVIFGIYEYKKLYDKLAKQAMDKNTEIENRYGIKAAIWSKHNKEAKLARQRAKVWREFLTFNSNVINLDFPWSMTIHKSQGQTFRDVILDMEDIKKCRDNTLKLKLLYVAITRAANNIFIIDK